MPYSGIYHDTDLQLHTPDGQPPELTDLDLTNIRFGMSPTDLEMIGAVFLHSAARLRANGFTGKEARA